MSTFDRQKSLPRLPVPKLEQTIEKYLLTIHPSTGLTTPEEYQRAEELAQDFLKTDGPFWQKKLLERDQSEPNSWLESWWSEVAYMAYRDSIYVNVTYGIGFNPYPINEQGIGQLERAARLTHGLLLLKKQIETETFPQDNKSEKAGMCMFSYRAMFHSCRIPGETIDTTDYYPFEETNHIVVVFRDQFYAFDTCDENGEILSRQALLQLFNQIYNFKTNGSDNPPVGVLALQHRDTWFQTCGRLLNNEVNQNTMDIIRKAAFLVCLDEAVTTNFNDHFTRIFHGKEQLTNRFYDAPMQIVVFKDATAGLIGEHSRMDGGPVVILSDLLLEWEKTVGKVDSQPNKTEPKSLTKLPWKLDAEHLKDIEAAHHEAVNIQQSIQCVNGSLPYGKSLWKTFKISPDAAVQMSLQCAYYSLHGTIGATYESVSTRHHSRGRTETGRVVSQASTAFVKAMMDKRTPLDIKRDLYLEASKSHVRYAKEAAQGFGCDRHLLGLRLLARDAGKDLHPFFKEPSFIRSCHWNLSTSTLGGKHVTAIGFGPVVEDGYGVCYNYKPDEVIFAVSAWVNDYRLDADKFLQAVTHYLNEIRLILSASPKL